MRAALLLTATLCFADAAVLDIGGLLHSGVENIREGGAAFGASVIKRVNQTRDLVGSFTGKKPTQRPDQQITLTTIKPGSTIKPSGDAIMKPKGQIIKHEVNDNLHAYKQEDYIISDHKQDNHYHKYGVLTDREHDKNLDGQTQKPQHPKFEVNDDCEEQKLRSVLDAPLKPCPKGQKRDDFGNCNFVLRVDTISGIREDGTDETTISDLMTTTQFASIQFAYINNATNDHKSF